MSLTLSRDDVLRLSERVMTAQTYACPIHKLTDDYPEMSLDDGYAVQTELRRQYERRGHRVIGWKAGLTSRAKMKQMGVDTPSIGFLTDRMWCPEDTSIRVSAHCHPRVECEIAFVTQSDLQGSQCTAEDVLAATDYVVPALEIIDSRFAGFKFDLESVVADNGSSARFVVGGRPRAPAELDLRTIGAVMEINGETVAMGASAEVLGHPAEAVALMVRLLHNLGESLPAGSFVLSGAITRAVPVKPGDSVVARFYDLGSVAIRFCE